MTWLRRTLPVSAVLHAAVGSSLFLLPTLSSESLPELATSRPIVDVAAVLLPTRVPVAVPSRARGRAARGPSIPAPIRETVPAIEPTTLDNPSVGYTIDDINASTGLDPRGEGLGKRGSEGSGGTSDGEPGSGGPVRPGGDLRPPAKVRHVVPAYPELARRAGVEGVVVLECVIDPSGHVAEVRILRSQPLLDAAAVEAVRQWVYSPTRLNGAPVAVLLTVTVQFKIPR